MELVILGSGTALPVAHKGPSAQWVSEGNSHLLVDCGSGVCQKLLKARGDLRSVEALLLTHGHIDHLGDLATLLFALHQPQMVRERDLLLFHSHPLKELLEGLWQVFGDWLTPSHKALRSSAWQAGERVQVGRMWVEAFGVDHHPTSLGYRITGSSGSSLAIPGDTGLCQSLLAAVTGVDCLLIECSTLDRAPMVGHMSPGDVIRLAREARPGCLVITHTYPEAEQARVEEQIRAAVSCPVLVASDGLKLGVHKGETRVLGRDFSHAQRQIPEVFPTGFGQEVDDQEEFNYEDDPSCQTAQFHPEDLARDMLERDLSGLDAKAMTQRKFSGDVTPEPKSPIERDVWGFSRSLQGAEVWREEDLIGLVPTREQKKLLRLAESKTIPAEVNLRGDTKDAALSRLDQAVKTWRARGERWAIIVTGKGLASEGSPIIKLAVLNWLSSTEGRKLVRQWAPKITADGNFGSLIIELD